jgi:aldose 1-epimerase
MVNEEQFSTLYKKRRVSLVTLRNPNGMRVQITNYGAKIVSLWAPDKDGVMADVVLGFNTFDEWRTKETYFNAIIGRYANRIKNGRFTLDGKEYQLATNNNGNALHGGVVGFNERVWEIVGQTTYSVSLKLTAADGEENYPGNLDVYVTYTLNRQNGLNITYEAKTDKPTLAAFTNHAYFNLKGEGNGDVRDHVLQVFADEYTPFDDTACPTGEILSVEGTPMDFRQPTLVGDRIDDPFFVPGRGIDNNFVLRPNPEKTKQLAAVVSAAGRTMEVYTTMPGLQVYTGNWIEKNVGKSGREYDIQTAICLEAQNFPNSPNCPNFPSPVLRPGEIYFEQTEYRFV